MRPRVVSTTMDKSEGARKKDRFGFTVEKDIQLLKTVLAVKPWQSGEKRWEDVATELRNTHEYDVTARTVKNRVDLLLLKYENEELKTTTGTEQQQEERARLLLRVKAKTVKEETGNTESGSSSASKEVDPGEESDISDYSDGCPETSSCDEGVDQLTNNHGVPQETAQPESGASTSTKRKSSSRLSPLGWKNPKMCTDDDGGGTAQLCRHHEMKIAEFEYERHKISVELERSKLFVDERRELRRFEQEKLRNELSVAQLRTLCELVNTICDIIKHSDDRQ